jgi:hypothetical protein
VVALSIVTALCAIGYRLRADITNPSTASCISVAAGLPALMLGQFLVGRRRRQRIREIRDARRGGISLGIARPRRERVTLTDAARPTDSGRHTGRRRLDLRASDTRLNDGRDIFTMEV